ncbi:MAG: 5'-methylthioadenosine/adenosylhomocysteine nucleosidase [Aquabacterium sp.]|uniref:5'-methylthioadenosine/adenosylhomocysteine nucleosidase n=1 Tax=Aquabacterium sp. TaxID=1872578 RepID=UPI0027237AD2|nr:5'-methylthioadenosine/adenosylhomocysteine nucleosidase [Aquabacterium sp.]MDO9005471.1 5'-methylthioadenosine/adenosylhomocysteine nucleosidase [Aquabacterium sp.]
MNQAVRRVAIVAAMPEELSALLQAMPPGQQVQRAGRTFWLSQWCGHEVVAVLSRIGKVAAATTTTLLLTEFEVDRVLFTGVAGGLGEGVRVGDVVVADALLQHDMDASPLFPRFELPGLGVDRLWADADLGRLVVQAATDVLAEAHVHGLVPSAPRVHQGLVISGDLFVDTTSESDALRLALPDALAVEMEGAALAQGCHDFGVPFAVIRTISDRADDAAHVDFQRFVLEVASRYSLAVVKAVLERLPR